MRSDVKSCSASIRAEHRIPSSIPAGTGQAWYQTFGLCQEDRHNQRREDLHTSQDGGSNAVREWDRSALDGDVFRAVLGRFCSGVVIVTSGFDQEPIGMTAQSFSSLSLDPPLVLFCPSKTSTTWPKIRATGKFCVNVLSEDQEGACRQFAVSGGDKFQGVVWWWSEDGMPALEGCLAHIKCSLDQVHDAGDHEIVVGRVTGLSLGHPERPLLFYQGAYRQLLHFDAAMS
jgi:3-hydroxy-9,10-secoandrosta-1,3,5(10)-triene-9,17-dione monooxygenase reductase component